MSPHSRSGPPNVFVDHVIAGCSIFRRQRNTQYGDITKLRILRFFVNKGLISHVTIKICKENFNIHTADIPVNKTSPYLSCSNMGK